LVSSIFVSTAPEGCVLWYDKRLLLVESERKHTLMSKGAISAAISYTLWGIFPIYFKALHQVPSEQVVAHRIVWSFLFLISLVAVRKDISSFSSVIKPRTLLIYLATGILLAVNWLVYIWAINHGFVVEASLGYFINPLVSVLFGMVFLGEKLRRAQWLPLALAAAGVTYLAVNYGSLPWIALSLAVTFGLYGLMKKVAPLGSLHGLTLETAAIFLPALGFLLFTGLHGAGSFGHGDPLTTILLVLTGIVTAIPLLFFAVGARRVPLSTMGLLQYISPTMQFLIGVFVFGEVFTSARLAGFAIIWLALIIFSIENLWNHRLAEKPPSTPVTIRVTQDEK
jgi:chloramphenicol-sensitive protein RarD